MSDAPRLPYGHQWIDERDIEAVTEVLRGGWLTTGPKVREFENALAELAGVSRAVVVNSGSALRSEEHTSELQSRRNLVCRLLLEKKK